MATSTQVRGYSLGKPSKIILPSVQSLILYSSVFSDAGNISTSNFLFFNITKCIHILNQKRVFETLTFKVVQCLLFLFIIKIKFFLTSFESESGTLNNENLGKLFLNHKFSLIVYTVGIDNKWMTGLERIAF